MRRKGSENRVLKGAVLRLLTAPKPKVPAQAGVGRDAYVAILNSTLEEEWKKRVLWPARAVAGACGAPPGWSHVLFCSSTT